MKKIFLILSLASLCVFGLATMTLAADNGVTFNIDYAQMDVGDIFDSNMFVLQVDYAGTGVFGLTYASAIDFDPDIDGMDNDLLSVYGGYNFLKDEGMMFAAILGYTDWSLSDGIDEISVTSLGIGFRTGASFDQGSIYLTYIYGISNDVEITGLGSGDDFDASLLELKGSYFFTDSFGLDLAYRSFDAEDFDVSGLALGAIFKF